MTPRRSRAAAGALVAGLVALLAPPLAAAGALRAVGGGAAGASDFSRGVAAGIGVACAATAAAALLGPMGLAATRGGARTGRRAAALGLALALGGIGWTAALGLTWLVVAPTLRADMDGRPDADVLALLRDPEPPVRRAAADAIAARRCAGAVESLVAALAVEPDHAAWRACARALGAVGAGSATARDALVAALGSEIAGRREGAFEALRALAGPADVPALVEARATGPRVAAELLDALILGKSLDAGDDPALVAALAAVLEAPDAARRRVALHALGAMAKRARAALPAVQALLGDPDAAVGWVAAWAVVRLHAEPPAPGRLSPDAAGMPGADTPAVRARAFTDAVATTRPTWLAALDSPDLRARARAAELSAYAPRDAGVLERLARVRTRAHGSGPDHDAATFALARLGADPAAGR